MKVEDMHGNQDVGLIKPFKQHPKGTLANVLAYSPEDNLVLVRLRDKNNTEEKIPPEYLVGVLFN